MTDIIDESKERLEMVKKFYSDAFLPKINLVPILANKVLIQRTAVELLRLHSPEMTSQFQFFAQKTLTLDDEIKYLTEKISRGDILWKVYGQMNQDFVLIGTAGLHEIDDYLGIARLGVMIWSEQYSGQGFATQIIKQVLNFAFNELQLMKVYVTPRADNPHGTKIWDKFGFLHEGTLFKEYRVGLMRYDVKRLCLMSYDWNSQNQKG